MSPDTVFSGASTLALLSWAVLAVSLFLPRLRPATWRITGLAVPLILALAYVVLLPRGMTQAPQGGFGSIVAVRALFASDFALTAGWLHYLAFDLFVGTFIAREGLASRVPALLILPCLVLTFLFGPAGLLLHVLLKFAIVRMRGQAVAS